MIENITLRRVATYGDEGIVLENLPKVSFIYGANGSGKTTISNFLSGDAPERYEHCGVQWRHGQPARVLVYNKAFRDKNFGKGTLEGIFTLGEATKEELAVIESKRLGLSALKTEGVAKREALDKLSEQKTTDESQFKELVWSKLYKKYEIKFKDAFKGAAQKESFKTKLLAELESDVSAVQSYEWLEDRAKTVFGLRPDKINLLQSPPAQNLLSVEGDKLWSQKIVGKSDVDIAQMIQALNLTDWVNHGRSYISNNVCPFCQQETITDEFKLKLDLYFDKSFSDNVSRIESMGGDYKVAASTLLSVFQSIVRVEGSNPATKLNIESFKLAVGGLESVIVSNIELVEAKLKEPSRAIVLHSISNALNAANHSLVDANKKIADHNSIVDNFKAEQIALIDSVWKFLAEEVRSEILLHKKKMLGTQAGIDNISRIVSEKQEEYRKLSLEIKGLVKKTTSVQPAVDEINRTLQGCGFVNFEIFPSPSVNDHYQIKRADGTLAEPTLSEGEITFITFLYFLQLAKGSTSEESVSGERVLVVDDPISSLDSSVLFVVSTLLKRIIRAVKSGAGEISQIIVMTHNVYFHKEVSFIDGRTKIDSKVNFWIIRKLGNLSRLIPYGMGNPINTSYELLWKELREASDGACVSLQNVMRRIIENYFKVLGKFGDDYLISMFTSQEDQDICRSLISWVNDGSHSVSDDLFIEAHGAEVDSYLRVFKEIFRLTNHEAHYDMMMDSCA